MRVGNEAKGVAWNDGIEGRHMIWTKHNMHIHGGMIDIVPFRFFGWHTCSFSHRLRPSSSYYVVNRSKRYEAAMEIVKSPDVRDAALRLSVL